VLQRIWRLPRLLLGASSFHKSLCVGRWPRGTALGFLCLWFPRSIGSEPAPEAPYEWIHTVWAAAKAAPIAIITALITCLAGYLSKTPPEKFKLENLAFTAIISFLIGIATVYGGWSYTQIELWLANGFLTWYIWKAAKIIAKKLSWISQATRATSKSLE